MKNEEVIKGFIDGRTLKTKNIFAEGNVLYDYGYHFPLLVRLKDGFIFNESKYSQTTSKHQNYCLRNLGNNVIKLKTPYIKDLLCRYNDKILSQTTLKEVERLPILEVLEKE